jgi:hypothetical protein
VAICGALWVSESINTFEDYLLFASKNHSEKESTEGSSPLLSPLHHSSYPQNFYNSKIITFLLILSTPRKKS